MLLSLIRGHALYNDCTTYSTVSVPPWAKVLLYGGMALINYNFNAWQVLFSAASLGRLVLVQAHHHTTLTHCGAAARCVRAVVVRN